MKLKSSKVMRKNFENANKSKVSFRVLVLEEERKHYTFIHCFACRLINILWKYVHYMLHSTIYYTITVRHKHNGNLFLIKITFKNSELNFYFPPLKSL